LSASESVVVSDTFYIFQYWHQTAETASERISVIFVTRDAARDSELARLLREHLELTYAPHRIVLLGLERNRKTLLRLQASVSVAQTPRRILGSAYEREIEVAQIDQSGNISSHVAGGELPWPDDQTQGLFAAGLALIFNRNGAVLDSSGLSYHFVAPSGRHQSTFIRVGNVFAQGSQTSFAASALLRLVPDERVDSIYVDSATIAALAYELAIQLCEMRGWTHRPVVSSFAGYHGLKTAGQPLPVDSSLVLISYSATGRLGEAVRARANLDPATPVINVFSDGGLSHDVEAACFLDSDNGVGERVQLSTDSVDPTLEDCALCKAGSSRIIIVGDQLLPLTPSTKIVGVKPAYGPSGLLADMRDLIKYEAVRVNVRLAGDAGYTREIFLDLSELARALEAKPLKTDGSVVVGARARLLEAASRDNAWIIHVDDDASIRMSETIRMESNRRGAKIASANVLSANEFLYENKRPTMGNGTVVVVAGAVASGRVLELLSEVLRTAHSGGLIHYVILFARAGSEDSWNRTKSNLEFGEGKPHRHRLSAPEHIELQPLRKDIPTSWELETEFWEMVRSEIDVIPTAYRGEALALIDARCAQITYYESLAPDSPRGLRNTLFLAGGGSEMLATNPDDEWHLRLSPNFSFWKFRYASLNPVQSDVYVTFSATLNRMRNRQGTTAARLEQSHDRTCIDPTDFGRYSDGVAQAALLRAARPIELDYSSDYELSAAFLTVIERLLFKPQSESGNALPEFLLAMAMGKLRLHPAQRSQLPTLIKASTESGPIPIRLLSTLALQSLK
jgi:hypothetical protein